MSDKIYTTSTNEGASNYISIRSEFQSRLSCFSEEEKDEIISAIDWFCECSDDEKAHVDNAILLGMLHIKPEQIVKDFGVDWPIYNKMSDDFIKAFQVECWYQYKKKFSNSLNIDLQDECKEAMDSLDKKTNDEGIISFIAFKTIDHCINKPWFKKEQYERNYALLTKQEENNYYGGLKNLVFEADIAQLLKAYHNEIADLLKAMWEAKSSEDKKNTTTQAKDGDVGTYNSSASSGNSKSNTQIVVPTPTEVFSQPKYSENVPSVDDDPVIKEIVNWVDANRKMEKLTGFNAEVLAAKYLR